MRLARSVAFLSDSFNPEPHLYPSYPSAQFNRIDIEVLSVIAQQVLVIQQGLMARATTIQFEGREIPLNPCFGVFITVSEGNTKGRGVEGECTWQCLVHSIE